MPYETFDHTADIGLRVTAGDLETLFVEAARGMFAIVAANLADVRPVQTIHVELAAEPIDELLFDWLTELLIAFDRDKLLCNQFEVRLVDGRLIGSASGEPADEARHRLEHEIKAVTYHGLRVEQTPDGWLAEVILDI